MWGKSLDCFLFQCRSRLFVVLFPPASTSANASRLLIISVVPFAFCVAAWLAVPLIYFLKALSRQEKFPLGHECRIAHAVEEGRKNMRDGRTEFHPVPLSLFFLLCTLLYLQTPQSCGNTWSPLMTSIICLLGCIVTPPFSFIHLRVVASSLTHPVRHTLHIHSHHFPHIPSLMQQRACIYPFYFFPWVHPTSFVFGP
ncbi:hypothetical protein DPX39_060006700 [Trypanosoma brucei equiperdum]|uniref:Transmembrane protein n=1 Tax=Trypanosoma brucei equiperdum TaxID=630700 RepID=A0A3L6L795_9TRYP|nr:hypothetical protein DPX39_060006700 [Trypanosoma brucei equiperdum]